MKKANGMVLEHGRSESKDLVYKRLGRIEFPNSLIEKPEKLRNKVNAKRKNFYALQFTGQEPLINLDVIDKITSEEDMKYEMYSSGYQEYWKAFEEKQELWERFDKIIIQRASISDEQNDNILGESTLTAEDYKKMPIQLREKIIFEVDYKKSTMNDLEAVIEFKNWAKEIGIHKIIFVKEEQEQIDYQEAHKAAMIKASKAESKQIEALRSKTYDPSRVRKADAYGVEKPLMMQVNEELMKEGYHFKAAKVEDAEQEFFDIRELNCKNQLMEIAFKTKIVTCKRAYSCFAIIYREIHTI